MEDKMASLKKTARLAGLLYLVIVLASVYGHMYVPSRIFVMGDAAATANNILTNEFLFRSCIVVGLIETTAFLLLALTLHRLLREINDRHAKLMVAFISVQIPVGFVFAVLKFMAITVLKNDAPGLIPTGEPVGAAMMFLNIIRYGSTVLGIFSGLWLVPLGMLIFKARFIPQVLGVSLIVAGAGSVVYGLIAVLFPAYGQTPIPAFIFFGLGEIPISALAADQGRERSHFHFRDLSSKAGWHNFFRISINVINIASVQVHPGDFFSFPGVCKPVLCPPLPGPHCFCGPAVHAPAAPSRWLERKGWPRGLAVLVCVLAVVIAIAGLVGLVAWQVSDLAGDVNNMEQKVKEAIDSFRQFISKNLGITREQQDQLMQSQQSGGSGQAATMLTGFAGSVMGILVDLLLVLVYIFLFMFFRRHLKTFILKLIPASQKPNAQQCIHDIQRVAQQYLGGLGMMIVGLWIMYGIGFSIVGVKNAFFFAILCGVLEIVPFVGNLTGNAITILMALSQGGGMNMVIGIIITYAIVQFLQSYILEPLVVGAEVNINPLFTILVIVLGELVWGIAGMVLAIPLLGMVKIVCDHIEPLKPYGFLIGEEKKRKNKPGFINKIKNWFK